jgi:hypothetical protein
MARPSYARGGAKPKMLPAGARDIYITIGDDRKGGMYELSSDGVILARRVELPEWLSDIAANRKKIFLKMFLEKEIQNPSINIGESRGHIFLHPPASLGFEGSAVGVDMEVFEGQFSAKALKSIVFYVYGTNHRLVERWKMSRNDFKTHAKLYDEDPKFMPQMMVELLKLKAV